MKIKKVSVINLFFTYILTTLIAISFTSSGCTSLDDAGREISIGDQIWMSADLQDSLPFSWEKNGIRYYSYQAFSLIQEKYPDWETPSFEDWTALAIQCGLDSNHLSTPNWGKGDVVKDLLVAALKVNH